MQAALNAAFSRHARATKIAPAKSGDAAHAIATDFFKQWFIKRGRSYHFLFRKNLRVTNIQFAELLALLKVHTKHTDGRVAEDLQFLTVEEFRQSVSGVVSAFASNPNGDRRRQAQTITNLYSDLLHRMIVVGYYYGSCAVYVPPHLDLSLNLICSESGYIHSCGRQVFVRNVQKAKKEHLYEAVRLYLKTTLDKRKSVFFAPYAHEDFTDFDREVAAALRDGLDDVKVHVEKSYFGDERLVSVLNEMRTKFKGRLEIPEPGNFKLKHRAFRDSQNIDKTRTLWLIVDRSIGTNPHGLGGDRFYILYDQSIANESPFAVFDENKPGWFAHTTMPHSLAAAMINITRPNWETEATTIADPFSGSGTVYFEALKLPNTNLKCADLASISYLAAKDNLEFFSNNSKELRALGTKLKRVCSYFQNISAGQKPAPRLRIVKEWITIAVEIHQQCIQQGKPVSFKFPPGAIKALSNEDGENGLLRRILFYIALRASIRNDAAMERASTDINSAFLKECQTLSAQIAMLEKIRSREEIAELELSKASASDAKIPHVTVYQSSYSNACTTSAKYLIQRRKGASKVEADVDAKTLLPNSVDVIVTDPPYGINTDDTVEDLAALYCEVLNVFVTALRENGHLVLCLPDKSFTGRRSPFFTHKELITSQVLAIASNKRKRVYRHLTAFPIIGPIDGPPYYWESERALRRAVLHFQFSSAKL